jgi:hypothetical protein
MEIVERAGGASGKSGMGAYAYAVSVYASAVDGEASGGSGCASLPVGGRAAGERQAFSRQRGDNAALQGCPRGRGPKIGGMDYFILIIPLITKYHHHISSTTMIIVTNVMMGCSKTYRSIGSIVSKVNISVSLKNGTRQR